MDPGGLMARTLPKMSDLVPRLREKVEKLAELHEAAFPERALALIWGLRTAAEQRAAYKAGRSKLDGVKRFSLHNYGLAADLWVYTGDHDEDHAFFENRPPRDLGLKLQLKRGALSMYYRPMGKLAEEAGLEAGAFWRMGDGPHVQLNKHDRFCALQEALNNAGYHCGEVDGVIGKMTKKAIEAASGDSGKPWRVSWRASRLMPLRPELFRWLVEQGKPTS